MDIYNFTATTQNGTPIETGVVQAPNESDAMQQIKEMVFPKIRISLKKSHPSILDDYDYPFQNAHPNSQAIGTATAVARPDQSKS